MVRMRDGVRLATDVYLPAARARRVPCVVVRLPYDRRGDIAFPPALARLITDGEWAVVTQDVRGKFASGGALDPFASEMTDGYDTLDWISDRPWSNRRVVPAGDSYFGYTAWACALSGHPSVVGVAPRVTAGAVSSQWLYRQGIFRIGLALEWTLNVWNGPGSGDFEANWDKRPPASLADGHRRTIIDRWAGTPPGDPTWRRVDLDPRLLGGLRIPVLSCGGWYDVFLRGQLQDWAHLMTGGAPPRLHRLVIYAADHTFDPLLAPGARSVDRFAVPSRHHQQLPTEFAPLLKFLHDLRDGKTRQQSPPVEWELIGVGWQRDLSWPPQQARPLTLYPVDPGAALNGPQGGTLAPRPERGHATVGWNHDPATPVPSLDEDPVRLLLSLPDERDVETREDVVTFTTPRLSDGLNLVGRQVLQAVIATTSPSTHVMAKLVDVFPNGWARRICEGAAAVEARPSEYTNCSVDLGHTAYRILPEHHLRLEIASSGYPRYIVHPGTSDHPWTAVRTTISEQTLRLGAAGSALRLSLLSDNEIQ